MKRPYYLLNQYNDSMKGIGVCGYFMQTLNGPTIDELIACAMSLIASIKQPCLLLFSSILTYHICAFSIFNRNV